MGSTRVESEAYEIRFQPYNVHSASVGSYGLKRYLRLFHMHSPALRFVGASLLVPWRRLTP